MAGTYTDPDGERSVSDLVRDLSQQSSELARKEVELAKAEMELKAKRLGIGAGAFGAAGLVGLLALGALTATLILALEAEIEATREELGDTVAELADKTDVKKQGKRKVARTKAKATAKKDEVKEKAAAQK